MVLDSKVENTNTWENRSTFLKLDITQKCIASIIMEIQANKSYIIECVNTENHLWEWTSIIEWIIDNLGKLKKWDSFKNTNT